MKPKLRGWKEGVITEDLVCVGGTMHKKGDIVRYKRHKEIDPDTGWTGKYKWHYLDQDNYNLIRTSQLLVKEE